MQPEQQKGQLNCVLEQLAGMQLLGNTFFFHLLLKTISKQVILGLEG